MEDATPFFQIFIVYFEPLYSRPATYTSVPETKIASASELFVPVVTGVATPSFQTMPTVAVPTRSYPAIYTFTAVGGTGGCSFVFLQDKSPSVMTSITI